MPSKLARRTVLAIAAIGAICVMTLTSSCDSGGGGTPQTDPKVFSWDGPLASGGSIHLRNVNGSIEVRPSADSAVHVRVGASWTRGDPKTDLKFTVVPADNDVTICLIWGQGNCDTHNYSTGPGFLKFMKKGTDATTQLVVELPSRVRIDAFTMNGTITIASTAPVKAVNVNGSVRVATAVGPVEAVTVNGSVDVRMTTLGSDPGAVKAETVNGTAKVYVPADVDADYTLKVTNGGVANEFGAPEGTKGKTQTGTLGKGGRQVTVKAMNGSVGLYRLNPDGTPMVKN